MPRVEYLVIGGYAVGFHGHPRATNDMDIWVGSGSANLMRIVQVLRDFGFENPILTAWMKDPRKTLRMGYPPARIEILTHISGIEFTEAWSARVAATLEGVPVNFIGLEQLKANKKAAGRLQNLADLENLP